MSKTRDEAIVLSRDKVYSSYYSRACRIIPDYRLVSISLGIPSNFKGEICRELNPPDFLLRGYKNGTITENEYVEVYTQYVLSKLNPIQVYNKLKGKVILCYCGIGKFCHRHLVIEWLRLNLGDEAVGGEI